ncbi:MAG: TraR/DksA C4-type zinc finger protein, partial [Methylomonas sp.]
QDYQPIRNRLIEMQKELETKLTQISDDVRHVDQPPERDFSEQAIENENNEVLDALGIAARIEIEKIKQAIHRIDTGVYGLCVTCGQPIKPERLAALPFVENCISCAQHEERK